jgi:RNA polymerase sigma-70 factor, ECF subfamily
MDLNELKSQKDEELVVLSLNDAQVFGLLIDRYETKLKRYIHRLTNVSDDDVQDLLQDVFIKAYYNLNGFDTSLSFSSWMYRIAHNVVISQHRKIKARPQGHAISIDEDLLRVLASELETDKEVHLSYLQKNIQSVFAQMDIKYIEVLQLRYFEQKDYKEISDILKKPTGTVSTLLSRAKKQFKQEASKLGLDL